MTDTMADWRDGLSEEQVESVISVQIRDRNERRWEDEVGHLNEQVLALRADTSRLERDRLRLRPLRQIMVAEDPRDDAHRLCRFPGCGQKAEVFVMVSAGARPMTLTEYCNDCAEALCVEFASRYTCEKCSALVMTEPPPDPRICHRCFNQLERRRQYLSTVTDFSR